MKYRPPFERKHGRWYLSASWRNLNLPRVLVYADGDSVTLGASYGTDGCDPALMVDVDLSGTRFGRALAWCYFKISDWQWKRAHPVAAAQPTGKTP